MFDALADGLPGCAVEQGLGKLGVDFTTRLTTHRLGGSALRAVREPSAHGHRPRRHRPRLDRRIGRQWIAAGHSEGGHAAFFAAAPAAAWAPELRLRGAVAIAPGSQQSLIPAVLQAGSAERLQGVTGYVPLLALKGPPSRLKGGLCPRASGEIPGGTITCLIT